MFETLHGVKKGIKDIVAPQGMFEDLGLKYLGPVDGHDEPAVERALRKATDFGGPVIVHVITQKGRGYQPAIDDEADQFHGVGKFNPETGLPFEVGRTHLDRRVQRGDGGDRRERPDVVALTAAMLIPVGLDGFAAAYPDRVFDVGIAEQHAVTMASGLAYRRAAPGRRRLRHLPQPRLRPAAHGLRPAPGRGHLRPRPGRASPAATAPRTTACGT